MKMWKAFGALMVMVAVMSANGLCVEDRLPPENDTVILSSYAGGKIYWLKHGWVIHETRMPIDMEPVTLKDGKTAVVGSRNRVQWLVDGEVTHTLNLGSADMSIQYIIPTADGTLLAADKQDGNLFWIKDYKLKYSVHFGGLHTKPVILPDGKTVCVARGNSVVWIRGTKIIAEVRLGGHIDGNPTVLKNGQVVITSGSSVYWLKPGSVVTKYNGATGRSAKVLGDGKTVVLPASDGKFYWLRDGQLVSSYDGGHFTRYSRTVVLKDGKTIVSVQTNAENVSWLKDGREIARVDYSSIEPGFIWGYAPILARDGKTVIVSGGGQGGGWFFWLRNGKEVLRYHYWPQ